MSRNEWSTTAGTDVKAIGAIVDTKNGAGVCLHLTWFSPAEARVGGPSSLQDLSGKKYARALIAR